MYFARRLFSGGLGSIFASAAVACGEGARETLVWAFAQATSSDVILGATLASGVGGLAAIAAAGAVWMANETVHPE